MLAPGKAELRQEVEEEDEGTVLPAGTAAWISYGLKIEEEQCVVRYDWDVYQLTFLFHRIAILKQLRDDKGEPCTPEGKLSLQSKRRRLQKKIDRFIKESSHYLCGSQSLPATIISSDWFDEEEDIDEDVDGGLGDVDAPAEVGLFPESVSIPLPSSFGAQACRGILREVARCECKLREGQANDALHNVRVAIARKSFHCRTRVRNNAPTSGYSKRLRSYGETAVIQTSINLSAKIYSTARSAIQLIDPECDILRSLSELTSKDLVASTAVVDPNARGMRNEGLSWIWQRAITRETPEFVTERQCLHISFSQLLISSPF